MYILGIEIILSQFLEALGDLQENMQSREELVTTCSKLRER